MKRESRKQKLLSLYVEGFCFGCRGNDPCLGIWIEAKAAKGGTNVKKHFIIINIKDNAPAWLKAFKILSHTIYMYIVRCIMVGRVRWLFALPLFMTIYDRSVINIEASYRCRNKERCSINMITIIKRSYFSLSIITTKTKKKQNKYNLSRA